MVFAGQPTQSGLRGFSAAKTLNAVGSPKSQAAWQRLFGKDVNLPTM